MASVKGKTREMSCLTEKMEEAINILIHFGHGQITARDVASLALLPVGSVASVLSYKADKGLISRVAEGVYEVAPGTKLAIHLPISFVAEKVFSVLLSVKKPLSRDEIIIETEKLAGRSRLSLTSNVSAILSRWRKDGYLNRTGWNRNYRYALLPGITVRPPLSTR